MQCAPLERVEMMFEPQTSETDARSWCEEAKDNNENPLVRIKTLSERTLELEGKPVQEEENNIPLIG